MGYIMMELSFGGMAMARDPICYADVDEVDSTKEGLSVQYNAQNYYFCSKECKERFERDPAAFISLPEWETTDDERPEDYVG